MAREPIVPRGGHQTAEQKRQAAAIARRKRITERKDAVAQAKKEAREAKKANRITARAKNAVAAKVDEKLTGRDADRSRKHIKVNREAAKNVKEKGAAPLKVKRWGRK
jgi:hypothetical protein